MNEPTLRVGILCFPTFGGSGVVATELAQMLARRGHQVHIISQAPPVRLQMYHPNVNFHEVPTYEYPLFEAPLYGLHVAATVANLADYVKLDVVHAHYALPHAVSAFLARVSRSDLQFRIVTTLHGTDITLLGRDPSFFPITRLALHKSDVLTCVSGYLQGILERDYGVPREKIHVIPNFVDTDRFRPLPWEERREKWREEKCLIHVSNFRPVKRTLDVIRTFERVRHEVPARLVMVGDGPERLACERFCLERGLQEDVMFTGKYENLVPLLQKAVVFLLTSELESFGLAALEAMSCGVPVVATRVGGITEVVEDGVTGFLADVGDLDAMAAAVLRLLREEQTWLQMAQAARRAAFRFEGKRVVPMYESLYFEVLSKPATGETRP